MAEAGREVAVEPEAKLVRRAGGMRKTRQSAYWVLGSAMLLVLVIASLSLGRYSLNSLNLVRAGIASVIPAPASWHLSAVDHTVLMQIRLPRVLAAVVVGAGLAASGASYQLAF